jgi:hypothetical protein
LPSHAEIAAERNDVDAVTRAKVAHRAAYLIFRLHATQVAVDRSVKLAFLSRRHAFKILIGAVDHHSDAIVSRNDCLKRDPPQFTQLIGKTGRDEHRKRQFVFSKQRVGPSQEIFVAIVEGEADETPREITFDIAPMHFVQRHHVNARTHEPSQQPIKKFRRNFQKPVWLERLGPCRPHMVQRKDGADAANEWTKPMVHSAEIQRLKAGTNDGFFQCRRAPRAPLRRFNLLSQLFDTPALIPIVRPVLGRGVAQPG